MTDLARRRAYDHWTAVTLRFSDQDSLGHINNVAYAAFVEQARNMYIVRFLDGPRHPDLDFVLARVSIDYRRELRYPGTVDVGARLLRLGGKSITTGYGVFSGDICVATAESVNVFYDLPTRRSIAPPDDVKQALRAEMARIG